MAQLLCSEIKHLDAILLIYFFKWAILGHFCKSGFIYGFAELFPRIVSQTKSKAVPNCFDFHRSFCPPREKINKTATNDFATAENSF